MNKQIADCLIPYLKAQRNAKFEWGVNDCCLFASSCVHVVTGFDPMASWRGKYQTEQGAMRLLKKHGGGSIKTAFTRVFGEFKPRLNANSGDLVLIDTELGDALGVLQACRVWVMSPTGLISVPISKAKGCWLLKNMNKEAQ